MSGEPLAPWGVMLPNFDPFRRGRFPIVETAQRAEQLGFDAVWVGDHLAFHPPILEATGALATAAAVTERVRLGFAVLQGPMRQPVWLAKSLQTIEHLAPGRLVAGLGVGGEHPAEWRAAGSDVGGRGRRLDAFLEVLPALLGGERVVTGPPLEIDTPPLEPATGCPPIAIGGRSDAAMRRAARFADAWITVWMDPPTVRAARARLADLAEEVGRPAPETMMVMFVGIGDDDAGCAADAARLYRGQYDLPWELVRGWTPHGAPARVAEQLAAYVDAGVTGFVVIACRPDVVSQVESLAEVRELVPRVR